MQCFFSGWVRVNDPSAILIISFHVLSKKYQIYPNSLANNVLIPSSDRLFY
jgi:hypothetical protein